MIARASVSCMELLDPDVFSFSLSMTGVFAQELMSLTVPSSNTCQDRRLAPRIYCFSIILHYQCPRVECTVSAPGEMGET